MKNILPKEYTVKSEYRYVSSGSNNYEGAKIVQERINKAWERAGHRDTPRTEVKVLDIGYGDSRYFLTRVYIGGWSSKRSIICSKRNQSIDMNRIIKAMYAKAQETRKIDKARAEDNEIYDFSSKNSEKLSTEFDLGWGSDIKVETSKKSHGHVTVNFERQVTVEEARKIISALKAL